MSKNETLGQVLNYDFTQAPSQDFTEETVEKAQKLPIYKRVELSSISFTRISKASAVPRPPICTICTSCNGKGTEDGCTECYERYPM